MTGETIQGDGFDDHTDYRYDSEYDRGSGSEGDRIYMTRDLIESLMGRLYETEQHAIWEELRKIRDFMCKGICQ